MYLLSDQTTSAYLIVKNKKIFPWYNYYLLITNFRVFPLLVVQDYGK